MRHCTADRARRLPRSPRNRRAQEPRQGGHGAHGVPRRPQARSDADATAERHDDADCGGRREGGRIGVVDCAWRGSRGRATQGGHLISAVPGPPCARVAAVSASCRMVVARSVGGNNVGRGGAMLPAPFVFLPPPQRHREGPRERHHARELQRHRPVCAHGGLVAESEQRGGVREACGEGRQRLKGTQRKPSPLRFPVQSGYVGAKSAPLVWARYHEQRHPARGERAEGEDVGESFGERVDGIERHGARACDEGGVERAAHHGGGGGGGLPTASQPSTPLLPLFAGAAYTVACTT